jgi:hypothetical protein
MSRIRTGENLKSKSYKLRSKIQIFNPFFLPLNGYKKILNFFRAQINFVSIFHMRIGFTLAPGSSGPNPSYVA